MKSVVLERFGEPREVLSVGDLPVPEPGPGQVRLKMVLSPIHNHDLAIIRGIYGRKPELPAVAGTEALGVVDKVGPQVEHLSVSQRVCAMSGGTGTWAEYFLAPAATAVPVPAGVPDESACQLLAMPLSATLLLEDLALQPGQWMIQNAAAGAVGRLVETLARDREINVINLVRRPSSVRELEREGARQVLATEDPGWPAKVKGITGGAPILRAVDSVGGRATSDLLQVLAPSGQLVVFGALSGQALVIDPGQLIFKQTVVKGFWATPRSAAASPADRLRMIGELVRLVASGKLPLRVAATFDLATVAEAVAASETPGRVGKIALRAG